MASPVVSLTCAFRFYGDCSDVAKQHVMDNNSTFDTSNASIFALLRNASTVQECDATKAK